MPSGFNVNIFNRTQERTAEELDVSLRTYQVYEKN
ncbi:Uncharacterised protein [Escherichia coli]|nr:Uncharacterised protein [Escherichia coli]